jgi:hypothetical protein
VRNRDDRALRSKAEKIHHRKEAAKENALKEAEAKKSLEEKTEGEDEVSCFQFLLEMLDCSLSLYKTLVKATLCLEDVLKLVSCHVQRHELCLV